MKVVVYLRLLYLVTVGLLDFDGVEWIYFNRIHSVSVLFSIIFFTGCLFKNKRYTELITSGFHMTSFLEGDRIESRFRFMVKIETKSGCLVHMSFLFLSSLDLWIVISRTIIRYFDVFLWKAEQIVVSITISLLV